MKTSAFGGIVFVLCVLLSWCDIVRAQNGGPVILGVDPVAAPSPLSNLPALYEVGPGAREEHSLDRLVTAWMNERLLPRVRGVTAEHPRYFLFAFGYQDRRNLARNSHTFASFVRVTGPAEGDRTWIHISWLPLTFDRTHTIRVLGGSEPGRNWSLAQTLGFAATDRRDVAGWGPIETTHTLYQLVDTRQTNLGGGQIRYIVDDHASRPGAVNCQHAVSDVGGELAPIAGRFGRGWGIWGFAGTENVLGHFQRHRDQWLAEDVNPGNRTVWNPR
jgi:hypothetical protein